MRVLGIDPGLRVTGYACVENRASRSEPVLIEAGILRLKASESIAYRLAQLHSDLNAVLDELHPDVMAVEKLFATYRHPRTPILMAHARGVVLLAAEMRSIALRELSATAVKKSITGNGHAGKEQVQRAVASQLNLSELPQPPDVADAIGIALTAARRLMLSRA